MGGASRQSCRLRGVVNALGAYEPRSLRAPSLASCPRDRYRGMRNLVFGCIGLLIGLALLIGGLTAAPAQHGTGAYGAGQSAGEVSRIPIAVLFLLAGLWAIRTSVRKRNR